MPMVNSSHSSHSDYPSTFTANARTNNTEYRSRHNQCSHPANEQANFWDNCETFLTTLENRFNDLPASDKTNILEALKTFRGSIAEIRKASQHEQHDLSACLQGASKHLEEFYNRVQGYYSKGLINFKSTKFEIGGICAVFAAVALGLLIATFPQVGVFIVIAIGVVAVSACGYAIFNSLSKAFAFAKFDREMHEHFDSLLNTEPKEIVQQVEQAGLLPNPDTSSDNFRQRILVNS